MYNASNFQWSVCTVSDLLTAASTSRLAFYDKRREMCSSKEIAENVAFTYFYSSVRTRATRFVSGASLSY